MRVYLAIDLGAESGRVIAGLWNGKRLRLEEIHRFPNGPVEVGGSLRWDVLRLWAEIQKGLAMAAAKHGRSIRSVGADTWGVDYVLLSRTSEMLGQPFHYRDSRTDGIMENAFRKVSRASIFQQTGLQFMQFNTLFQLLATKQHAPELLEQADCLLFMPDFIHWALCGSRVAEFTIASTSQCLHPLQRDWAGDLLKKFGLPKRMFPEVVPPERILGKLRPELGDRLGLSHVKVVAPPSHDTRFGGGRRALLQRPAKRTGPTSAPAPGRSLGVEVAQASLTERTRELNLTNEGGWTARTGS